MDDQYSPRPIAGWFMIGAVASLLFMGLGCVAYLMHVLTDPNSLPLDQRAAYLAEPAWVTGANAVAVWVGLAGTILLVMKKKLAAVSKPMLREWSKTKKAPRHADWVHKK